jgi:hypothetical protein
MGVVSCRRRVAAAFLAVVLFAAAVVGKRIMTPKAKLQVVLLLALYLYLWFLRLLTPFYGSNFTVTTSRS